MRIIVEDISYLENFLKQKRINYNIISPDIISIKNSKGTLKYKLLPSTIIEGEEIIAGYLKIIP